MGWRGPPGEDGQGDYGGSASVLWAGWGGGAVATSWVGPI